MSENYHDDLIFALDIGTRSIIGVVGRVENDRFRVLAIEKEEHVKRAMMDGQIEDIAQVARVVKTVTTRLEEKLGCKLTRVCIAAAGRALHTEKGGFSISLPGVRRIDDDLISRLEAGAVSNAESNLIENREDQVRFYLVGYTVTQYLLDRYPMSNLRDHTGQELEVEVVATFLPGEVVESLYSAMQMADLEVVSLTLEPIAALNAAIPEDIRLLNLVLADIGAGTSDIAACRDGSVVGYTMATIAGDEITECIMKALLVDFQTAERLKAGLATQATQNYHDVLGMDQEITAEELLSLANPSTQALAEELSARILEINGGVPSAVFLSGGGSKLDRLKERVAESLQMDMRRVAIAGNNFEKSAFSDGYDLNDPEYATPLGIAISAGLGLINDSYRVTLNGEPAKLFRSGSLTVLDVLMMNGYGYADLIGRTGQALTVTIDGKRTVYRGQPAIPSLLTINGKEVSHTAVVNTGDKIQFTPAQMGKGASKTLSDVVGGDERAEYCLLNDELVAPNTLLHNGDVIITSDLVLTATVAEPEPEPETVAAAPEEEAIPAVQLPELTYILNGNPLNVVAKEDGLPHYLMDLLEYSGIDFQRMDKPVVLYVNGKPGMFSQALAEGDNIEIRYMDEEKP